MTLPLRAIAVFDVVARCCSLTKAAAELYVTPSAVSQQIHALELHLGTTLLKKAGRGVVLTEAGERYFEMIAEDVQRITEATQRIRGFRSRAALTVRTTPTLGSKWLLPRLQRFLDANPDVELRLNATTEPTDFSREDVDVEIRHGEGQWPGVFVEGLAEETYMPVCAPSYAQANSMEAAELQQHRLIHSVKAQLQWAQWFTSAGVTPSAEWSRLLFDRSHMAIDAATDGLGVALESNLMMWRELRHGTLVCPVRNPPRFTLTTQWVVCPFDHLRKAKVQLFLEWIRQERVNWQNERVLPAAP
ncbi:LysR substrate-binding domain-containing protein [Limnohabitans sp.]|jgi:DNA-binding transcriptional LysR family regulator|uniref:LysR substrate-binding domain-containing protein n=1 Tax=Limnohabitans sp. TaxID=1907725 RepID=UPI0037BE81CC